MDMSGMVGPNGVGVMYYGARYVLIREDVLASPDFDAIDALAESEVVDRDMSVSARESLESSYAEERKPTARYQQRAAVYRYFDADGRLLYVGKAVNPAGRQRQHEKRIWWRDVDTGKTLIRWYATERDALDAEDIAIRDERPVYNKTGGFTR